VGADQMEKLLDMIRQNEIRLRRAELIAGFGNWKFDLGTRLVDASEGARRIYGLGSLEWVIENVQKIPLPEHRSLLDHSLKELTENNIPYDIQFKIKRASDGEIRDIHSIAEFDRQQNVVFGVIHDITEQIRTEKALRDSETRWKALVENVPDVIVLADLEGKIFYINRSGPGMLSQPIIGTSIFDWPADESVDAFRAAVENARQGKSPQYLECLIKLNYPNICLANRITTLEDKEHGNYLMIVAVNITESQRTMQALNVSLEKYRTLFESFPLGVTITDERGGIVEANQESEKLLGISLSEHTQRQLDSMEWTIIQADGSQMPVESYASVRALKEQRMIKNVEMGVLHSSGEVVWLDVSAAPIPLAGYGVAVTYGDITEQKKIRQALHDSEEKYRQLVENASEAVYVVQKGRFVFANPTCEKLIGMPAEQLMGISLVDFLIDSERDKFFEHHQKLINGGTDHESIVFQVNLLDGKKHWLEINAVRIIWGDAPATLNFATDITGRILAEEEIRRLNGDLERRVRQRTHELEAANQELESFAYSVSHDLRSPLRAVDGFSKLLLDEYGAGLDENGRDYIERIRSGVHRMGHLIEDLLRLSRVTRTEMHFKRVDLSRIASEVMAVLEKSEPDRKVEFRNTHDAVVTADERLMQMMMENLLGNAWKFTSQHPTTMIEFGQKMIGDQIVFFVRDDGAGFDMQYVHKLFGVFQRLHAPNQFSGNGIGLVTAKRILARHGGHIWAEGAVERGAVFYFSLD
jgi:PAS domain S-box-containing protein